MKQLYLGMPVLLKFGLQLVDAVPCFLGYGNVDKCPNTE